MSAELKFTDRDVRESDDLVDRAMDYLLNYEGEFQFLVDCKMRLATAHDLTVGMVRGVLNCMRADPRVLNLPDPLPAHEGNVIPMRPAVVEDEDFVRHSHLLTCEIAEPHERHGGRTRKSDPSYDGFKYCSGVYLINREPFALPAIIKPGAMMSQTGELIHRVDGSDSGFMGYDPPRHEYGWGMADNPWFHGGVLSVRNYCKYPRWIRRPILLWLHPVEAYPGGTIHDALGTKIGASKKVRKLCERCFD